MSSHSTAGIIPEYLIYEIGERGPIYYKGYQLVLSGAKTFEEVMGDSNIQAWLKAEMPYIIKSLISKEYVVTAGEQGLSLKKGLRRSVDIAIFRKENFVLSNKYSQKPPEVIIEIDTKADIKGLGSLIDYYEQKIQELQAFGVQKIIWIFTDTRKVRIIESEDPMVFEWNEDFNVLDDVQLNVGKIIDQFNLED